MSNLSELKPVGSITPFTKFCCTIGNLPSSYMQSFTYEEQLLWLCDYLQNTVIPAVNTNAEAVAELQGLYIELKDYVDHYFENLDVQNEINNKLDEMASDGTLNTLIEKYYTPFIENQNKQIANIAKQVNSAVSGTPLPANSISEMTNTERIYVNSQDGKWYYYNGENWVAGGNYQAVSLSQNAVNYNNLSYNLQANTPFLNVLNISDNLNFENKAIKKDSPNEEYSPAGWYLSNYIDVSNFNGLSCSDLASYTGENLYAIVYYSQAKILIGGVSASDLREARNPNITDYASYDCFLELAKDVYYIRVAKYSYSDVSSNPIIMGVSNNSLYNILKNNYFNLYGSNFQNKSVMLDGTTKQYAGWFTSDFILVKNYFSLIIKDLPAITVVKDLCGISFYDKNKKFISGYGYKELSEILSLNTTITAYKSFNGTLSLPNDTVYIKISRFNFNDVASNTTISIYLDKKLNYMENNSCKILCIGDSLTEGDYGSEPAGTVNVHSENYPYFLSNYLQCSVTNKGRSGFTPIMYWNNTIKTIDFSIPYDIVIILLGTNGGLTDTIDEDTNFENYNDFANTNTGRYCSIIEYIMEHSNNVSQIILCTPPHAGVKRLNNRNNAINSNPIVKKIGQKYSLPVIDLLYELGINDVNQNTFQPIDNLHFNEKGYQKMGTFIGSQLISLYSFLTIKLYHS